MDVFLRKGRFGMKNFAVFILLAAAVGLAPYVHAAETSFIPSPFADMWDLDHWRYYTWGVDLGFSTVDTPITEAVLTFNNIRNWDASANVLYIHLLDGGIPLDGFIAGRDLRASGDYFEQSFAGEHVLIDEWTHNGGQAVNLEYRFSEITLADGRNLLDVFNEYGADGYIGFGFDPDCHYYNSGISFQVVTAVVPAPGAVMLGSMGVMLVGWLRRRRNL